MRVLRVGVGILTLLLAIPVLVAGGVAWWVMQHRSPDGAFHAELAGIVAPSRVIVVPDIDAVLRRDAPIARADHTVLRIRTDGFIGMADPGDVAAYLAGAGYTEVREVSLGRGALPVGIQHVTGSGRALADPEEQSFWYRSNLGELAWSPSLDRDQQVALVIVAPRADPGQAAPPAQPGDGEAAPAGARPGSGATEPVRISVDLTAGWLNSTTWGLLILGPVLLLLGLAALAWPQRPREIVYVMDSAAAVQAGLPQPPALPATVNPPYQSPRSYSPPVQAAAPPAELGWPPPEPTATTDPPRGVEDDGPSPDLPMPIAGVHLHLTQPRQPAP